MADEQQFHDPATMGCWEGDTYVLNNRLLIAGRWVEKIRIPPDLTFGEGITRDEVVHAMLNPITRVPLDE